MCEIKTIFFDVGSTLVDESLCYDDRIIHAIRGTGLSFREVDLKRKEFASCGLNGDTEVFKYYGLNKIQWNSGYEKLYFGIADLLEYLKMRGYKLGIIANQKDGLFERLNEHGILKYFDERLIVSSADVGCEKPDKRIFKIAVEQSGVSTEQCLMVGDRLDQDIVPAKNLGMKTCWVRSYLNEYYKYTDADKMYADIIIEKTVDLKSVY